MTNAQVVRRELPVGELTFTADCAGDEGEIVLLLHGFPQTSHTWRHQLPALAEAGYRAIAPNQRGYSPGARPSGVESYTADLLVDDVLALADSQGAQRFHVVGHDWGGQIAWLAAAWNPERVASLTVLSRPHPAAFAAAIKDDEFQAGRSKHHRAFLAPDTAEKLLAEDARRLRRSFAGAAVPGADVDAYLEVLEDHDALNAAVNWYRAAGTVGPRLAAAEIGDVSVPTLYLWGDSDMSVGRVAAEGTASRVTGPYTFVELEGVNHFITDETPQPVTDHLIAHIQEHPA